MLKYRRYDTWMIDFRDPLTFNERQLFELVLRGRGTSRAAISEATGLTAPTVSRLVTRLVDLGIFAEAADRSGQLGQPRKTLSVRKGQIFSIGMNFMRGRFDLAVVDLAGDIVAVDSTAIDQVTTERVAELSAERAAIALKSRRISPKRVIGAGFSLPGGFAQGGELLLAHEYFPGLDRRALAPVFSEAMGMPCIVDTDGACATLGEFLYGAAWSHDTFFFVHVGHGVGGGAIIGGQLFRGAHGNASKPGVLFPYGTPRPSGQDLIESLQSGGYAVTDIDDLETLSPEAEPVLQAWLDRAASQLAELGRVITAFLDPEIIYVGGRLPARFNRDLATRLAQIELPGPSRDLPNAEFRASALNERSGVLGAACLPIFQNFFTGARHSTGNVYRDGRRAARSKDGALAQQSTVRRLKLQNRRSQECE